MKALMLGQIIIHRMGQCTNWTNLDPFILPLFFGICRTQEEPTRTQTLKPAEHQRASIQGVYCQQKHGHRHGMGFCISAPTVGQRKRQKLRDPGAS